MGLIHTNTSIHTWTSANILKLLTNLLNQKNDLEFAFLGDVIPIYFSLNQSYI